MKRNQELVLTFPEVTVMFCQVCDFSKIVAFLPPKNVVELLNIVFSAFDRVIDKNCIFKVETVSEVYMAVAGCPLRLSNHGVLAANAALDMQEAMTVVRRKVYETIGYIGVKNLDVRIGLNSGPIVSGVIGKKNPRYKLFGDTVNTASRMESTCEFSKIQCSNSTYSIIQESFDLNYRGTVEVKGKGSMNTYYLKGNKGERLPSEPNYILERDRSVIRRDSSTSPMDETFHAILQRTELNSKSSSYNRNLPAEALKDMKKNSADGIPNSIKPLASKKFIGGSSMRKDRKNEESRSGTYTNIFAAVDGEEFKLPYEYRSLFSSLFAYKNQKLEKMFINNNLSSVLSIIRFSIVCGIVAVAGQKILQTINPSITFNSSGVTELEPKDLGCSNATVMEVTHLLPNLKTAKVVLKYWMASPFLLITLILTYIPRVKDYYVKIFSIFCPIFATLIILISMSGLKPTQRMLEMFMFASFNISVIPFPCN